MLLNNCSQIFEHDFEFVHRSMPILRRSDLNAVDRAQARRQTLRKEQISVCYITKITKLVLFSLHAQLSEQHTESSGNALPTLSAQILMGISKRR